MRRIILSSLLAFALVINVAGCLESKPEGRSPLYKVSGTVKYKEQLVEGAMVTFSAKVPHDGARPAVGFTDGYGKYHLTTFDTNDGASAGEMVVTISKHEVIEIASKKAKPEPDTGTTQSAVGLGEFVPSDRESAEMLRCGYGRDAGAVGLASPVVTENKLPAKYADPQSSGLVRTIEKKDNSFNFDLTD